MRRVLTSMVATLVLFGAFLAFSGIATANHGFAHWDPATPTPDRLHGFAVCIVGGVVHPADTGFWVAHGWSWQGWSEATVDQKRGFSHPTTTFMLDIDGTLQKSALHVVYDQHNDMKFKWFVTEIHKGLPAGLHVFTYMWYIDGAIDPDTPGDFRDAHFWSSCSGTVNFV